MKVVVFGATGGTGRYIVQKLIKAGHYVTVFARSPEKVSATAGIVKIVKGDARDASAVAKAIAGQDAVIAAFGPRSLKRDDLQEVFFRNVIGGMQQAKVHRLVNLSALGAGDSGGQTNTIFKLLRHTLLKNIYDDKNRGEALITTSNIIYTNVRPGRLADKPARGNVKASLTTKGLSLLMNREDVADFMVTQLSSKEWERKSPLIGY